MKSTASMAETVEETPIPWNQWFHQYKTGDGHAAHLLWEAAKPFAVALTRVPYFKNRLGSDEIYSIIGLAFAKLLDERKELPVDEEVPYLLKCAFRRELVDAIHRQDYKKLHEQPEIATGETDDGEADNGSRFTETTAIATTASPEEEYEHAELRSAIHTALQQLPYEEMHVIRALFYEHKGMKEIAKELHCTFQGAYKKRRRAFLHLQKMLDPCVADV
ncbi:MAG: sigma-70 family RNA polymerase sigma factor [Acidaminococcaceae bacterium]|nr:sigma-70 family RNA polymerase sigma factor [Acidaminococcaceae bacterium]